MRLCCQVWQGNGVWRSCVSSSCHGPGRRVLTTTFSLHFRTAPISIDTRTAAYHAGGWEGEEDEETKEPAVFTSLTLVRE